MVRPWSGGTTRGVTTHGPTVVPSRPYCRGKRVPTEPTTPPPVRVVIRTSRLPCPFYRSTRTDQGLNRVQDRRRVREKKQEPRQKVGVPPAPPRPPSTLDTTGDRTDRQEVVDRVVTGNSPTPPPPKHPTSVPPDARHSTSADSETTDTHQSEARVREVVGVLRATEKRGRDASPSPWVTV